MLDRSPARHRKRRGKKLSAAEVREREQDAKRQREKRKRDGNGIVPFPGRASAAFIEAMKARAIYFGASKLEAERDADDPKKIAALAFDVLDDFAAHWYERK